jgi:hypothetical protein
MERGTMIKKILAAALVSGALLVPSQVEAVAAAPSIDAKTALPLRGVFSASGAENRATPPVFPPNSAPHGQSYGKWTANWWQQVIAIPADENPLFENGPVNCNLGKGKVVFLVGTFGGTAERSCTVPPGTALLLPLINSGCTEFTDGLEDDAALRACAKQIADTFKVDGLKASVDGKPVTGLEQFRFASPLFTIDAPAGSILGNTEDLATKAVVDGYYVMLTPLTPGVHTVTFGGTGEGFSTETTYHITVK